MPSLVDERLWRDAIELLSGQQNFVSFLARPSSTHVSSGRAARLHYGHETLFGLFRFLFFFVHPVSGSVDGPVGPWIESETFASSVPSNRTRRRRRVGVPVGFMKAASSLVQSTSIHVSLRRPTRVPCESPSATVGRQVATGVLFTAGKLRFVRRGLLLIDLGRIRIT